MLFKFRVSSFFVLIVHFTVVCLVVKPLNRNEAKDDLVMTQTLLLFKCKLLCYHANWILVSITIRSPSASLQIKGSATKYTTVKWPVKLFMHVQYMAIISILNHKCFFLVNSQVLELLYIRKPLHLYSRCCYV